MRSKRDETKFQQTKKEIKELEKERELGLINLFCFDESSFSLDPVVPYAWQVIGQQIKIPASSSKRLNRFRLFKHGSSSILFFLF